MDVADCVSISASMEYYENRLGTFNTYPKQMLQYNTSFSLPELDCIMRENRTFASAFDVTLN